MKKTFSILIFLYSTFSFGQIQINVTKISNDSVKITFPENMKIDFEKEYVFEYKTNVKLSDSLTEGLSQQILYDGLKVTKSFNHYEYGINITSKVKNKKKNTYDVGCAMFYINGTEKWKVKLGTNYISRYFPNDIFSNSKIEIEIQSDNYDLKNAKYSDSVILFWMQNKTVFKKFDFDGTKISINLEDYTDFMEGYNKNEKYNHIVILLPQVTVKNHKFFSDEQKKRMYILRFVKQ
jgi:hypothetical protein